MHEVNQHDSWSLNELSSAGRENLDAAHAAAYDSKEDAAAEEEVRYLQRRGHLAASHTVVDLGAGTGQFAVAASQLCRRVVAVDISAVMRAELKDKIARLGLTNIEVADAGFLTYGHRDDPADLVYSRYALHHLPDFWKAQALLRMGSILRPGGALRLWDIVYHFDPAEADDRIKRWISNLGGDVGGDHGDDHWSRAELAEHVRDEYSTYTWLLEPMIERAGFDIVHADYDDAAMSARYLCQKR